MTCALGTGVSAASFSGAALAPNSIVALFGAGLAKETTVAATQPLPTDLAGTRVTVLDAAGTSRAAQLFFVSPGQVNLLVPAGTVAGTARASITVDGNAVADGPLTIAAVAPALFSAAASGQGVAAAVVLRVKPNGAQSYEALAQFDPAQSRFVPIPIDLGPTGDQVFLILYGTGFRFRSNVSSVLATIGGTNAETLYAGPAEGFIGLDQANLRLPRSLAGRGLAEVVMTVDGKAANTVTVQIK